MSGKGAAYRMATKPGEGVVYRDDDGVLCCDDDSNAVLYPSAGAETCIMPMDDIPAILPKNATF